ncbi:MAG: hypothetical protein LBE49_08240 [Deltaproteobacteria bacterium]|nr:hypothetical protein [Deltaproteobacteria bacterium]
MENYLAFQGRAPAAKAQAAKAQAATAPGRGPKLLGSLMPTLKDGQAPAKPGAPRTPNPRV